MHTMVKMSKKIEVAADDRQTGIFFVQLAEPMPGPA